MTREEMIDLIDFIIVACPQQKIGRATAVPWFEIIGDLDFTAARNAVISVKHSQAFVDVSDIATEVKRARAIGQDPERHPSARPAREAMAASALRGLEAGSGTEPTPEYLQAKVEWDRKQRERAQAATAVDQLAAVRAERWLAYKLGKAPAPVPLGAPAAPRWVPLPGDPPELRAWLVRQPAEAGAE